jgi:predicted SAM-dependent methyltransferase
MNRYLISKGWEGFCDRLQCLSHSINLALHYNRILYVDWEDRIWSHDGSGFYRYFDLVDLPYVTSSDQIPGHLKVFPPFWRRGLSFTPDEWLHKLKDELVFDPQIGKHFEPVWVHPGVGFRAYDFGQLITHIRFTAETAAEVNALVDKAPDNLPLVHLRGTDRAVSEERWAALMAEVPIACVISDDALLARRWCEESPDSVLLTDTLVEGTKAGHKLGTQELEQLGVSKHQMNIRLLSDFVVLALAKEAHALNEESLFFKMARLFGACKGVPALFKAAPSVVSMPTCYSGYSFENRSTPESLYVERRLHIGGKKVLPGWEILEVVPGPHVDHIGNAKDLSRFADDTFTEVYASHVLEHFDYKGELLSVLKEWRRVLKPCGRLYISVPDIDVLTELFQDRANLTKDERFFVMRMIFGGHINEFDYHVVGLNEEFLSDYLKNAGFMAMRRVEEFGLFQDTSTMLYKDVRISLNMIAEK